MPTENWSDYLLVLRAPDGKQKLAGWTTGEPHVVKFRLTGKAEHPAGTSSNGEPFTPKVESGTCSLELTSSPKYLRLGSASVE